MCQARGAVRRTSVFKGPQNVLALKNGFQASVSFTWWGDLKESKQNPFELDQKETGLNRAPPVTTAESKARNTVCL